MLFLLSFKMTYFVHLKIKNVKFFSIRKYQKNLLVHLGQVTVIHLCTNFLCLTSYKQLHSEIEVLFLPTMQSYDIKIQKEKKERNLLRSVMYEKLSLSLLVWLQTYWSLKVTILPAILKSSLSNLFAYTQAIYEFKNEKALKNDFNSLNGYKIQDTLKAA